MGFKDSTRWKQFCARRLHLIHNLSLNLRKASEQEEQVRALASELCAEYGFTARAKPDFEKLLIAGIQSVRRNQKRSGRHLSSVPAFSVLVREDGNLQDDKSSTPFSDYHQSRSPLPLMSSKSTFSDLQMNLSSDSPLAQSLAARIGVLRDLVNSSGSRVTLDSSTVIRSNAQSILSIAVSTAVMHANLPESGALALQNQVNCGKLVEALCGSVTPSIGADRFLDCLGTLAASLVHGPLLLGALQALFVCLSQISKASVPRMIEILQQCSLGEDSVHQNNTGVDSLTAVRARSPALPHMMQTTPPTAQASTAQLGTSETAPVAQTTPHLADQRISPSPSQLSPGRLALPTPPVAPAQQLTSAPLSQTAQHSDPQQSTPVAMPQVQLLPMMVQTQRLLAPAPLHAAQTAPRIYPATQRSPPRPRSTLEQYKAVSAGPQGGIRPPSMIIAPETMNQPPTHRNSSAPPSSQDSVPRQTVPSIRSLADAEVISVAGPDKKVTLRFGDKSLELTYSPLKATPPTIGEIIDSARQFFGISLSTVVRVKDARTAKIIESNSELVDSFSMPEIQLDLIVPPPMLIDSLKLNKKSDVKFTPLAPIMFNENN